MRLVQVRECDGVCCDEHPRWPNEDGTRCIYHVDNGCELMRDHNLIPEVCPAQPHLTGCDAFIITCMQFPQNKRPGKDLTGGCCWQWVDGG